MVICTSCSSPTPNTDAGPNDVGPDVAEHDTTTGSGPECIVDADCEDFADLFLFSAEAIISCRDGDDLTQPADPNSGGLCAECGSDDDCPEPLVCALTACTDLRPDVCPDEPCAEGEVCAKTFAGDRYQCHNEDERKDDWLVIE